MSEPHIEVDGELRALFSRKTASMRQQVREAQGSMALQMTAELCRRIGQLEDDNVALRQDLASREAYLESELQLKHGDWGDWCRQWKEAAAHLVKKIDDAEDAEEAVEAKGPPAQAD